MSVEPTSDEEPINAATQPDLALADVKHLFDGLPDDWRIMLDSPRKMLLFDAELNGQGYIDLASKQVVTLQA